MSDLQTILAAGRSGDSAVPYLLDLALWYQWHAGRGTLPPEWAGFSMAQVAHALGVAPWIVERPWRVEYHGVTVTTQKAEGERVMRYETPAGALTARWSLGPDGDWWQTEYPVKTAEDLPAALAVVAAQDYVLNVTPSRVAHDAPPAENTHSALRTPHSALITALELPMHPYSDLLHTLLGWGEGLLLLKGEGRPIILEMLALLEEKLARLTAEIAALPGAVLLAPDNLDGQYVSPRVFRESLAESYRRTAEIAHRHDKRLVVHAGGPVRRLLSLLAEAGVDVVEGVAPPPQGDVSLAEARAAAGPGLILWGGIPQDYLLPARDEAEFTAAVHEAARQAADDGRTILGVADRVPVGADLTRLQAIPQLIRQAVAAD
jgi:hypothetical protein